MSLTDNILSWHIPTYDHQTHDVSLHPLYRYGNDIPYGIERAYYIVNKDDNSVKLLGDKHIVYQYEKDIEIGLFCIVLLDDENIGYFINENFSRIIEWMSENCSSSVYRWSNYFYFKKEQDAMVFKMRWC